MLENLLKRGYFIVSWYCMCRNCGETMNHFLIMWLPSCGALHLGLLGFNWYNRVSYLIYYVSGGMGELNILQKSRTLFLLQ